MSYSDIAKSLRLKINYFAAGSSSSPLGESFHYIFVTKFYDRFEMTKGHDSADPVLGSLTTYLKRDFVLALEVVAMWKRFDLNMTLLESFSIFQ